MSMFSFLDINSPLDQFNIFSYINIRSLFLGNLEITLNNMTIYLMISLIIILIISVISLNMRNLYSHNIESINHESLYVTSHVLNV